MHQLSSKILITLVSAITLNGCQLGTKEINSHTKPLKDYSLNYRTVNINAYSNEHVLPNKEERKEKYEKLRKQDLVKDEQLAKYPDRKEILHDLLAKLPTEFLTKLKDFNKKIEFLTSDDDSDKYCQVPV